MVHGAYEEHRVGSLRGAEIQAGIKVLRSGLAEGRGTGYVSSAPAQVHFPHLVTSFSAFHLQVP